MILSFDQPYDWPALVKFFAARAIPGVDKVDGETYSRSFALGRNQGSFSVTAKQDCLVVGVAARGKPDAKLLADKLRRLFGLDAPGKVIAAHLRRSETLARSLKKRPGLRVPGAWDPFELGVRAILGQQVSVAGATTLAGRIALKFGKKLKTNAPGLTHLFPTAETVAEANLQGLGLTTRRAATITGFAKAVCITPGLLDSSKPLDDFVADLKNLNGFGPWTAHYMAMRLGYTDAFPASDLGIRKALAMAPEKEILARAETWRPYRASAAMHLWMSLGD